MKHAKKKKQRQENCLVPEHCPICGAPIILRSADGIYKENPNHVELYVCSHYPACDVYVRADPKTKKPIGTLADQRLRALRAKAHKSFDQLYLSGTMTKNEAYSWLAGVLQAPKSKAHIGYLGEYYCKLVIEESDKLLAKREKRALHPIQRIRQGGKSA